MRTADILEFSWVRLGALVFDVESRIGFASVLMSEIESSSEMFLWSNKLANEN